MIIFDKLKVIHKLLEQKMNNKIEGNDLLLLLLLDIITFEIKKYNFITDKTGEALIQMTSFNSIEYYYHGGYLELDYELKVLANMLTEYNDKLKEYKLGVLGTKPEDWGDFFKECTERLLNNWT